MQRALTTMSRKISRDQVMHVVSHNAMTPQTTSSSWFTSTAMSPCLGQHNPTEREAGECYATDEADGHPIPPSTPTVSVKTALSNCPWLVLYWVKTCACDILGGKEREMLVVGIQDLFLVVWNAWGMSACYLYCYPFLILHALPLLSSPVWWWWWYQSLSNLNTPLGTVTSPSSTRTELPPIPGSGGGSSVARSSSFRTYTTPNSNGGAKTTGRHYSCAAAPLISPPVNQSFSSMSWYISSSALPLLSPL